MGKLISRIYGSAAIHNPRKPRYKGIPRAVPPNQITTSSQAERAFIERARTRGWEVLRNGWPDFMLVRKRDDGVVEFQAVEVKQGHDSDPLRDSQQIMVAALALQGIPVSVWSAEKHTLRTVERIDAQRTMDDYFRRLEQDKARRGIKSLRQMGITTRYDD